MVVLLLFSAGMILICIGLILQTKKFLATANNKKPKQKYFTSIISGGSNYGNWLE